MAAVLVMVWSAGPAWAEDGDAPAVKKEEPKKEEPKKEQPKVVKLVTGTALDGALAKLELADDAKAKLADAVKTYREKAEADRKALAEKKKALQEQADKEADEAKKKDLKKQASELKGPTNVEQYKAAKEAVKAALSEEQFNKLDELTKAATVEHAAKGVEALVAGLAGKGVELTADQKTKVEAEVTKMKDELGKADAGANPKEAIGKVGNEIRKNILTDEQRAKLNPPKKEGEGKKEGAGKKEGEVKKEGGDAK